MGMYCECGVRRNTLDENGETVWDKDCLCDLTGFIDFSDKMPDSDGVYEVRVRSTSGDIYHQEATFLLKPIIKCHDGFSGNQTNEYHWKEFTGWYDDIVDMWRAIGCKASEK